MLIDKLKRRLGTQAAAFEDTDLTEFIETAKSEYKLVEGEHDSLIVELALCTCYLRLATDTATYFKYSQGTESVDKTVTPRMFMEIYEFLFESVQKRLPEKPEIFQIKKAESDE
jgi:hypothetical protein